MTFKNPSESGAAVPLPRTIRQVCDSCLGSLQTLGHKLFCRRCGVTYEYKAGDDER